MGYPTPTIILIVFAKRPNQPLETLILWIVGACLIGALLSFMLTDTTQPPSGGDDGVPWADGEEVLDDEAESP